MIIEIPDDNSIVKWKKNDKDEWASAEISDLIKAYEKRPQGDLISREALKAKMYEADAEAIDYEMLVAMYEKLVNDAQAVEPERPQGEWVYRQEWFEDEEKPRMAWGCNLCGHSIKSVHEKLNFCPNCGAQLRS